MQCPTCGSRSVIKHKALNSSTKELLCIACHQTFRHSYKRQSSKLWLGAIGTLLVLSPMLLNLSMRGMTKLLPQYSGDAIDTIVVLGRGSDSQTERALIVAQLWAEQAETDVFVSGMTDAPPILKSLVEMGVPEQRLRGERCSQTTWENGLFSMTILNPSELNRILLVSDEPHLLRAFLVFKGFGFDVVPYAIESESMPIFSLETSRIVLREYAALMTYSLSGKLRAKSAKAQAIDQTEAQTKIGRWKCQI